MNDERRRLAARLRELAHPPDDPCGRDLRRAADLLAARDHFGKFPFHLKGSFGELVGSGTVIGTQRLWDAFLMTVLIGAPFPEIETKYVQDPSGECEIHVDVKHWRALGDATAT